MKTKKIGVPIMLLAAVLAVFTYLHALSKAAWENNFYDFAYYWKNASLLRDGCNVWEHKVENTLVTEKVIAGSAVRIRVIPPWHSTGFFAVILPFTYLSFKIASWFWLLAGHIAFMLSIWFLLRLIKKPADTEDFCSVLFLVFSFWPLREQLYLMQPNLLILFLITGAFYLIKRQIFWSGVLLGLAVNFREYLGFLCLIFILKRLWKGMSGAALGFLSLKAAGVILFGWEKELSYLRFIRDSFVGQINLSIDNHSLTAFLCRVGVNIPGKTSCLWLGIFLTGFLTAIAMYAAGRKSSDPRLGLALFSVLILSISPWVHECHYIILYPAIIISWIHIRKIGDVRLYWVFIVAYLLLGLRYSLNSFPQFYRGWPHIFMGGKLCGAVLLFCLVFNLTINTFDYEKN